MGHIITQQRPDFDSRSYGYTKLSDLITGTTLFEINRRSPGDGKPGVLYARDKRHPPDRKPRSGPAALQTVIPAADGDPGATTSEEELPG